MKKMRTAIWFFGLSFFAACVSKQIRYEVAATVVFTHADTIELNEAFKTIEGETTVKLNKLDEASCESARCSIPVRASGPVVGPEARDEREKANVRGTVYLSKVTTANLLARMEQARIFGKEQTSVKGSSKLSCLAEQCTLTFVLPDRAEVFMDRLIR